MFIPDPESVLFPPSRMPDPGPGETKDPGSGIRSVSPIPNAGPGTKKQRIPDPDRQH
jgi:hypothetical protein